jgi:RNA polymerase sigma-70 factor (sigma-E family)
MNARGVAGTGRVEFAAYYGARYRSLRRTAYLLSGSWHDAEDLTQAAFVKLYLAWWRVRPDGADGYSRRVLVNEFLAGRRRIRERPVPDLPDLPATAAGSPDDRLDLAAVLRTMPARQRAAVVLRYWEGLSVAQTASLLGLAEGTVKSQSSRGLATLRAHLAPQPTSPAEEPL